MYNKHGKINANVVLASSHIYHVEFIGTETWESQLLHRFLQKYREQGRLQGGGQMLCD